MERTISESERKDVFDALVTLKKALELGIVSADDILNLVSRKLDERNKRSGSDRRPPQQGQGTHAHVHHHHHHQHHRHEGNGSEQKVRIECPYCHGLGKWKSDNACKVCGGARFLLIPTSYAECGRCYGLGSWKSDEPCSACKGIGHVPVRRY